jgi:hypothetical protein
VRSIIDILLIDYIKSCFILSPLTQFFRLWMSFWITIKKIRALFMRRCMMSNQPEIDVERRRKADKPTERAEAPIRQQTSGGGTTGGGGGGSYKPSGGGFNIPTKGKMGGCGGILVIVLIIAYYLLSGSGGTDLQSEAPVYEQPTESNPVLENLPTNTPRPTKVPVAGQTGQKWLVMLYDDADDEVLEQDIFVDLNEAETVGPIQRCVPG